MFPTVKTAGEHIFIVISQGNPPSQYPVTSAATLTCGCDQETCSTPAILPLDASSSPDDALPTESVRSVEEKDKHDLQSELFKYMKTLLLHNVTGAVASLNIMHEFTPFHIQQVLNNCDKIKTLRNVEQFVEVWRKEHSRAIFSAIQVVFGDVDANELKEPEHEDEMDEFAQEWVDIRDDSELCQMLSESDLTNLDVDMEEIDQSGNEQRNMSSINMLNL